jgi:hypothetical protein
MLKIHEYNDGDMLHLYTNHLSCHLTLHELILCDAFVSES